MTQHLDPKLLQRWFWEIYYQRSSLIDNAETWGWLNEGTYVNRIDIEVTRSRLLDIGQNLQRFMKEFPIPVELINPENDALFLARYSASIEDVDNRWGIAEKVTELHAPIAKEVIEFVCTKRQQRLFKSILDAHLHWQWSWGRAMEVEDYEEYASPFECACVIAQDIFLIPWIDAFEDKAGKRLNPIPHPLLHKAPGAGG